MNRFILATVVAVLMIGLWTFGQANEGEEIKLCVNKVGLAFVVGDGFKRDDCRWREKEILLNTEGVPGPQGEKGEQGELGADGQDGEDGQDAQHGAGNIAFIFTDNFGGGGTYLLKTDGTAWSVASLTVPPFFNQMNPVKNPPVPVSDIVEWHLNVFLDRDGNYWYLQNNPAVWFNLGPLP